MSAFYHGITKKLIVAFGAIFSDIHIIRRKGNTVTGEIGQDILVPISYGPKDKWVQAMESDPSRQMQTKNTLPRMSFEISGFTFDATRKTTRTSTVLCTSEDGTAQQVYTPAPWNVDFMLYLVAKNQEDIFQMLEQILPKFNPDFTVKIRTIPPMGIVQNVPISLMSIASEDNFDGSFDEQRLIVYTLTFTAKANYYGEVSTVKIITDIGIGIDDGDASGSSVVITSDGSSKVFDIDTETGVLFEKTVKYNTTDGPKVIVSEQGKTLEEIKL